MADNNMDYSADYFQPKNGLEMVRQDLYYIGVSVRI